MLLPDFVVIVVAAAATGCCCVVVVVTTEAENPDVRETGAIDAAIAAAEMRLRSFIGKMTNKNSGQILRR